IQPLPSWNMESFQSRQLRKLESKSPEKPESRRDRTERFVQEPDFLPEEFSDPAGPRPTEEMAPEAMWEIKQRMDDAKSALDQAFEAEEAVDFDETVPSRSAWEPQAAQEPEWLADAEVDEDTDSGPGVPTLEPPMEPEWLLDELPFDDETVLGSGRETTLTEPPSMPEELFFDEDEDVQAAPASAWEEAEDATWDAEPEWDLESESAAAHQEVPPSLPGFEDDWELTIDEASDEHTVMLERPYPAELPVTLGAAADFEPQASEFDLAERDDPYIAQIALSLTQVSLELAAEATLLTSNEEIVAFAGQLTQDEVEELRAAVADDWTANPNEARVRFITLASSGKDYMLYSRKTVNDFTLTMIFSGTTPLRDIRRQGRRLIEALESVPEDVLQEETETLPELATMTGEMPAVESVRTEPEVVQPFTYLWVLREPDQGFSEHAGRAIAAGLNLQLGEMGWQVKSLRAQGEYVYVHADVPGEQPAYAVIDDLKRRAGEIAQAQEPDLRSESLWADSYLVMMPGRELEPDEIDQFITFERMA
ncbi:MAG: hypothetical protein K8J31_16820, partial [Anaerolineae bacterium]|nr:hypothetical protein [Anaerolineae bacterium]